ncbi:AlpA family phage regulatory protein [Parerythrobacter jejuensis]|uniref:AlpA family phage regulatory protein n=1 Tax=Parerythrobacter jejuensis TaxID=795812 RepID=A0A845ASY1_9SPHN|nr:AlpA family transcriptional regulator [Parerythrobacter jejuensis]MXP30650.1 AlpA family phage regulatory protein [Parerythrobacter jejuensis]MXP33410.1 AlpA family phage regulatory protein [Parerythrobacter jejuensis]
MRLIRLPEVRHKTGLSRSRIYADETFPKRVPLGARGVAWVEAEIEEWIQERIERRD